jgi:RNA-directed DNA polymerase
MLEDLDKELERRGLRLARYADDCLICVRSQRAAQRVLRSISRFIEGRLRLRINPLKTKAARRSACTFLGFELRRGRLHWTDAAVKRFKERIREITKRSNGRNMKIRIEALKR